MNVVDIAIFLVVALGAVFGFKHGAIKEGFTFFGTIIVIILSFVLKDRLMILMYENLPFFDFFGFIRGISAINVLFYQLVSFLIVFAALTFVLRILIVITGFVEWLLKKTLILSMPSKIIGAVIGCLEYYCYVFLVLYILNMPFFNLSVVYDSMFGMKILENTPVLSGLVDNTVYVYSDVWNIIKNKDNRTSTEINTLVLASLLDNKLISLESAKDLVERNKVVIEDKSLLDNYDDGDSLYNKLMGVIDNVS